MSGSPGTTSAEDEAHFEPEIAGFYDELAEHNERAWFGSNRERYDRLVRSPLEELLEIAGPEYGPGRVMRPNRDVRFSADKRPYRTAGSMWAGRVGGVYLTVDSRRIQTGGGLYEPSRDQLNRARDGVSTRPALATELRELLAELERSGFERAGPDLTGTPRGYSREDPAIDLLRMRHYAATRPLPLTASTEEIVATWAAVQPLIRWCERRIGPPEHPR